MTTSLRERTEYAPPTLPEAATRGDAAQPAHGVARRLLGRFALISLGLYHIPLFLNNYPSLGGGGFNDTGLAPRWGHVFTPIGIWVARHVFGMTGPMTSAMAGDNGDVGEEYGRLLVAVVLGVVGAIAWTVADRRRAKGRWVESTLRVLLRYSTALGLMSYAIAKLLPQQFRAPNPFVLETRLGDMPPMGLLWNFMGYSRPYALFGGVMELIVVILLCFRRTATLGAFLCVAVMTNVALMNYAYGVPVKLYATMTVVSAAVLLLLDAPRLIATFITNRSVPPAPLSPDVQDAIKPAPRWAIKIFLVGSVALSSLVAMWPSIEQSKPSSSPLAGAWMIVSQSNNGVPIDWTGSASRWRRLIVDDQRVAIRFATDTLVACKRNASPDASTLDFQCRGNRLGDLRVKQTGDTLALDGTFAGEQFTATARRIRYGLLNSKFRLISDR